MRDCYGTELEVGQTVAFNLSGDVMRGKIVRLSTIISISVMHDGVWRSHISKVKNARSVLVLNAVKACPNCGQSPVGGE